MLNGWVWRETCGLTDKRSMEDEIIRCAQEPMYAAMRKVESLLVDEPREAAVNNKSDGVIQETVALEPDSQLQFEFDSGQSSTPIANGQRKKRHSPYEKTGAAAEQISLF